VWVTLLEPPPPPAASDANIADQFSRAQQETLRTGVNLRFTFMDANPNPQIVGFDRLDTAVSYFISNDPSKWRTNVPVWGRVRYVGLYPGIDLEITSLDGKWAWRLVARDATRLSPEGQGVGGGDVRLRVEGADQLFLDDGYLRLTTGVGQFRMPLIKVDDASPVPAELKGDAGQISPASYRRPAGLAVRYFTGTGQAVQSIQSQQSGASNPFDLLYSTYLGGNGSGSGYGHDSGHSIAVDANGAAYVTGYTQSPDFPTVPGSFSTTFGGGSSDAFVTKLNATGSGLIYSTFLGGSSDDRGRGIEVDASGAAYLVGYTGSADFPITSGALIYSANFDVFVTKLNANGNALIYSTFLGGTANDQGYAIDVDTSGAAYITGNTRSSNFPITSGAFQTTCISCTAYSDAFVVKIDPSQAGAASLIYSTYLGGGPDDSGESIAVDGTGSAYVTGHTGSSNFPTQGAFQAECQSCSAGYSDAFVTKLNVAGSDLIYSTYLGGNGVDGGSGIAVDASGAAYIAGVTSSTDFPTLGALQSCGSCPNSFDAFVTKLNTGGGLAYSTYLGGSSTDNGDNIAVDTNGAAYVVGYTRSSDFPTAPGAFQTKCASCSNRPDIFVTQLNAAGSGLAYSTFLGGSGYDGDDGPADIAVDSNGGIYVTGNTK
jgi:hypothetical protein